MKKKRILCSALAAAMLVSAAVPAAGAARFPDSAGHWSEAAIDRWSDYGVIVGANGQFSPDAPITRGEMASIIAGMLGLEETASNRFSDLNGGWYTDAMLKCYAAGILVGDDLGLMRPYDNITGQEVAVILCKSLGLSATPYASTGGMVTGEVDPWAQGYISALASRGAVIGNDGGYFVPMTNTSRAAVVSMFDRAIGTYISSPGTYTAAGLTIVNTSGTVTLKGTAGDVIVTAKSDKLKLKLDDARVTGKLELRADEVQLTADDTDISGDIIVMGKKSTVSLNGKTEASAVCLESNADSSKITVAKNAEASLIRTAAQKSDITVSGEVDDIELLSGATSSDVNVKSGGKVTDLDSAANKVTISGDGTLKKATISGDNNKIDTDGTKVTVEKGTSGTKVNGSSKKSGSTTSSSKSTYYDVTFDYNYSGKKDKTVSVKEDKKVSEPSDPYRDNYLFDGWYTKSSGGKKYDFSDKVTDDFTLYAHWTKCTDVSNEVEMKTALSSSSSESYIRLTKDITVTGNVTVPSGKTLVIASGVTLSIQDGEITGKYEGKVSITYPQAVANAKQAFEDAMRKINQSNKIKSVTLSGSAYTVVFVDDCALSDVSGTGIISALVTAADKVEGLKINGTAITIKGQTSAQLAEAISGAMLKDATGSTVSALKPTTVALTAGKETMTYTIQYTVAPTETSVSTANALTAALNDAQIKTVTVTEDISMESLTVPEDKKVIIASGKALTLTNVETTPERVEGKVLLKKVSDDVKKTFDNAFASASKSDVIDSINGHEVIFARDCKLTEVAGTGLIDAFASVQDNVSELYVNGNKINSTGGNALKQEILSYLVSSPSADATVSTLTSTQIKFVAGGIPTEITITYCVKSTDETNTPSTDPDSNENNNQNSGDNNANQNPLAPTEDEKAEETP